MKIALIGATGYVGSRILNEAISRGHRVTALARSVVQLDARENLLPVGVDANDASSLLPHLAQQDAVIVALKCSTFDPHKMIALLKRGGVPRVLAI